ncbi:aaa atpase [Anopheles darlingi]|uniref:Aaa atpase n=1 Tax=Anopheles darlingi TaxID=43151 RepID=W5J393_ANODA|nr:aaa atpase [Anopheles darlingi]
MSFEQDRRSIYERRRNILYLVANYLTTMGLHQTRQALVDETQLTSEFEVCDNIDLDTIYQDFCSYFLLKFGKQPRIVKRTDTMGLLPPGAGSVQRKYSGARRKPLPNGGKSEGKESLLALGAGEEIPSLRITAGMVSDQVGPVSEGPLVPAANPKLLVRLQDHFTSEWKDLAEEVCRDLIRKDLRQRWHQVKGLEGPIQVLKESVIAPLEHPELFVGLAQPWRCVLLHGAPGTGKTLLARTLCSETRESVTFFSTSASTLISKWRGESEKLIRVLYEVAKFYAPSIIFIDEFDSLASRRDTIREHEASKRFKNEFLALIDGLEGGENVPSTGSGNGGEKDRVFLLASTNLPWEIDPAFLRRFERKILVDLPTADGRKELIEHLLPAVRSWTEQEMQQIVSLSENWTGDEVRLACKEASMMLLREKMGETSKCAKIDPDALQFPMLRRAFEQLRPGCAELAQKHRDWSQRYGTQLFD